MRNRAQTQQKEIFYENVSETILRRRGGVSYSITETIKPLEDSTWSAIVTDNTATEMFLNGETNARYIVSGSTVKTFHFYILAVDEDTFECKSWECVGFIRRDGANNTRVKSRVDPAGVESVMSGANFFMDYDDTNESLKPICQGINGKTINFIMSGAFKATYGF